MLNSLFNSNAVATNNGGANQLHKTAMLTSTSEQIVNSILKIIESDESRWTPMVAESQKSHDAMDKLVTEAFDLTTTDISFLTEESTDTLDKMIRSQQSKRSRAKTKVMTLENYKTMMTGAVAELLLRLAGGKPKSAVGGGVRAGEVTYSEDELQKFINDQEALKREIRNVQSKKSIMKSKADFDEASERWQQLLMAEDTLKSLRVGGTPSIKVVDEKASKIKELIGGRDVSTLKASDAKALLDEINKMINDGTQEDAEA